MVKANKNKFHVTIITPGKKKPEYFLHLTKIMYQKLTTNRGEKRRWGIG